MLHQINFEDMKKLLNIVSHAIGLYGFLMLIGEPTPDSIFDSWFGFIGMKVIAVVLMLICILTADPTPYEKYFETDKN